MNRNILKTVIYDQHEIIRKAEIVPREFEFDENANYVLTGLRRAGKSTMLYKIVQDLVSEGCAWNRIIYINFEDERLSEFTSYDFNDILSIQSVMSDEPGYFFFDEIQNIPGWEKFARRMADAKERVFITGSNAKMLSGEIASTLGGRYLIKKITPYSFDEYLRALDIPHDEASYLTTKSDGKIRRCCEEYLKFGALPETLMYRAKREYISGVFQKVLLGDIAARNNLRNVNAVRILIKKIAETVCSEVSYTRLTNTLKSVGVSLSKDTVIDYVQHAEDSYLVFHLRNYYASSFSDREGTPKYYFSDNGLLNLFLTDKDPALLENAVACVLSRFFLNDLYYLKSAKTGIDIDFFLPEAHMAIQVAWSLAGDAARREILSLRKLKKALDNNLRLMIVTYDDEGSAASSYEMLNSEEDAAGAAIEIVPLHKFLLSLPHLVQR